jgi:dihydropteroate synthase
MAAPALQPGVRSQGSSLRCAGRVLELDTAVVMGVLNLTPDSFSDGGRFLDPDQALAQAELMAEQGAAILDIGGESTRPGAVEIEADEQLHRILPVVERVAARLGLLISVDTSNPQVMRRAGAAGAHMINDVRALRVPGALQALADGDLGVCLMHMRGEPLTMQRAPQYRDVLEEVRDYLAERVAACVAAGIDRERLCLDPGFGFGKTAAHNLILLQRLEEFECLGRPLLVGLSRKSLLAKLTDRPVEQRLAGSVALAAIAVLRGARIVRAHDVAASLDAARVGSALRNARSVDPAQGA